VEGYSTMMAWGRFIMYLDGKHATLTRRCGLMTVVPAVRSSAVRHDGIERSVSARRIDADCCGVTHVNDVE
jgi:hypothetical protein